jgi:Tfp pilus assembly protein PilV
MGASLHSRSGQAMIIATLTLGGAILGVTALAGLLTLYNIRGATDSENSAKAIFAADAGVNWSLYSHFDGATPLPTFVDSAVVAVTCYKADGVTAVDCANASATQATSEGTANNSSRAFVLDVGSATSTVP